MLFRSSLVAPTSLFTSSSETNKSVSGLTAGTYTFKVRAITVAGVGAWSDTTTVTLAAENPNLVLASASVGNTSSALTWSKSGSVRNDYFVVYDSQGGSTAPAVVRYESSTTVTVGAAVNRSGYEFAGWCTSVSGAGTCYQPGATLNLNSTSKALYASWKASIAGISGSLISGSSPDSETVNNAFDSDTSTKDRKSTRLNSSH